jgi:hypothetical protein
MLDRSYSKPTLVAFLLFLVPLVAAWPQVIEEVDPPQGFVDEATALTVLGADLVSGSRILLRPGGPAPLSVVPRPANVAAFWGDRLVLASSAELSVVDIGDPRNPILLGRAPFPPEVDWAAAIEIEGHRAYVMLGYRDEQGARRNFGTILDLRDPGDIRFLGDFGRDPGWPPRDIEVDGDRVYLLARDGTLQIWDVADPARPNRLGATSPAGHGVDVEIAGTTAYVSRTRQGLELIDVSDPASPVSLGFVADLDEAWDLALALPYGYVATNANGLRVYDFTDQRAPAEVGAPLTGVVTTRIIVDGTRALSVPGLEIVGLEDPRNPEVLRELRLRPGSTRTVLDATENLVLIGSPGLSLYSTRDLNVPEEVVATVPSAENVDRSSSGPIFYMHGRHRGAEVTAIAIDDPREPLVLQTLRADPDLLLPYVDFTFAGSTVLDDVAYVGFYAYYCCPNCYDASFSCGLGYRMDFASDPTPALAWGGSVNHVTADEARLYLGHRFRSCGLLGCRSGHWTDIFDPVPPTRSTRIGDTAPLFATGGWLFLAGNPVRVVDARDPYDPVEVGELDFVPYGGVARGGLAYLAMHAGLVVMDLEDTSGPRIEWTSPVPGRPNAVVLDGDRLLVATTTGLGEFDIRDPERPELVRLAVTAAGDAEWIDDDHMLLNGGQIVRLNPRLGPSTQVDPGRIEAEVPSGFAPGPYDVLVVDDDGGVVESRNAFLACERRDLEARLIPLGPAEFVVEVDGDPALFGPGSNHEATLALPKLPGEIEVLFLPGYDSEDTRVDLWISGEAGSAVVALHDDDRSRAERVWNEARESGGFSIAPSEDRQYGPVALSLGSITDRPPWLLSTNGEPIGLEGPAERSSFVYEVKDGYVVRARAAGDGADLVTEVRARDDSHCRFVGEASLHDTLRSWCDTLGSDVSIRLPGCS